MQVGQVLREARLKKGIDLYEVKRVTKISVPALRAMEEDRWDDLPESEAEEQLTAYADFLGLDHLVPPEQHGRDAGPGGHARSVLLTVGVAALVGLIIGLIGLGPLGGSGGGGGGTVTT